MLDKVDYKLPFPIATNQEQNETTIPTLSILLFELQTFRKEVIFFQSQFQGPDYFNIVEYISELQSSIESSIQQLKIQVSDFDNIPYKTLSNSLEYPFKKNIVKINSDAAGIALMLLGLKNLIHTNRKAAFEAEESEDFFIESLLLGFEKELERNRWIFYLFSKY